MKKVLIIFPPFGPLTIKGPHLAPALLKGILSKEGHEVKIIDLNVRLMRHLLTETTIKRLIDTISKKDCEEKEYIIKMLERAKKKISLLFLPQNADWAIFILTTIQSNLFNDFPYNFDELISSFETFKFKNDDIKKDFYNKEIADEISAFKPDIIGLSCSFGEQLFESLRFANLLKNNFPETILMVGGAQISLLQNSQIEKIQYLNILDYIFVGQAENDIIELIKNSKKQNNSKISLSKPISFKDLDKSLLPEFEELNLYFGKLTLPVLASKGCYWGKCTFCDFKHLNRGMKKSCVLRTPQRVFKEICDIYKKYNCSGINLISDAIPPRWYQKLSKLSIKHKRPLHTWCYMLHSKQMDDQFFSSVRDADIRHITIGTESTCDRILELMKKPSNRDVIFDNYKLAHKYMINIKMDLIIDYPTITNDEMEVVLNDLIKLSPYIYKAAFFNFRLSRNSDVYNDKEKLGIVTMGIYEGSDILGPHGIKFSTNKSDLFRDELISKYHELASHIRLQGMHKKFKNNLKKKKIVFNNALTLLPNHLIYHPLAQMVFKVNSSIYQLLQHLENTDFSVSELELKINKKDFLLMAKYGFLK